MVNIKNRERDEEVTLDICKDDTRTVRILLYRKAVGTDCGICISGSKEMGS